MGLRVIESEAIETILNSINTLIEAVCTETNDLTSRFDEEWIESSELSAILGVSIKTLHNYKKQGLIGYSIIGRKLFFKRSDVDKTLKPKLKKKIDNNGTDKKR